MILLNVLIQESGHITDLSSSQDPGFYRRGKFFALFLVSTSTSFITSTAYTTTYKFTVDCTAPGPFTYVDCP